MVMTFQELKDALAQNPAAPLTIALPDGSAVPVHFHVTEVGRVQKDFIDCGGTIRSTTTCVIQLWVASDREHRLLAGKFAEILQLAAPLIAEPSLPVEFEYETDRVSLFPLGGIESTSAGCVLQLANKHTACLAPHLCLPLPQLAGCGPSGCC